MDFEDFLEDLSPDETHVAVPVHQVFKMQRVDDSESRGDSDKCVLHVIIRQTIIGMVPRFPDGRARW